MTKRHCALFLALVANLLPIVILAGDIGEPAPPLVVKEWVKGSPVEIKPGTNIYVVEIFGSASAANLACMTNLDLVQRRFATNGVVVVGVNDGPADRLKAFMARYGSDVAYTVASDEREKTASSYLLPVRQRVIPYAFVVGTNGTIIWRGAPLTGLTRALEEITTGHYDFERVQKLEVAGHQMEQYLILCRHGDFREKLTGETLLANRTNDVELLCDMAYEISTEPGLRTRNFELAGRALDEAEKLSSTNTPSVMIIRAVWLFESEKQDEGMDLGKKAYDAARTPQLKSQIKLFLRVMASQMDRPAAKPNSPAPNSPVNRMDSAAAPGAAPAENAAH